MKAVNNREMREIVEEEYVVKEKKLGEKSGTKSEKTVCCVHQFDRIGLFLLNQNLFELNRKIKPNREEEPNRVLRPSV